MENTQPTEPKDIKTSNSANDFVRLLLKKWQIIAICTIVFGVLAGIYAFLKTPQVTVKATVLIAEDSKPSALSLMSKMSLGNLFGGSGSVDNEQYVMGGHNVFEQVVKKLGLNVNYIVKDGLRKKFQYPTAPVMLQCDSNVTDTLSSSLIFKVKVNKEGLLSVKVLNDKKKTVGELKNKQMPALLSTPYGDFGFIKTDKYEKGKSLNETITLSSYSGAAEAYASLVKISLPSKRADVITLSINHVNAGLGKLILAYIIDTYNEIGSREKSENGFKTLRFIDERIAQVETELMESELSLEAYKSKNKIADVGADLGYAFQSHGVLQKTLVELETKLQSLELIKQYLNSGDESILIPEISLNDEDPIRAISDYNQLVMRRRELARSAKSGNVALEQLEHNISSLRSAILQNINQAIRTTQGAINEIKTKDREPLGKIGEVPEHEKNLRDLARQQTIKEQLYVYLLEQREQIAMTSLNSLPRGQVIENPYVLAKAPGLPKIYLVFAGLIFGFFLGAGFYYIRYIYSTFVKKA